MAWSGKLGGSGARVLVGLLLLSTLLREAPALAVEPSERVVVRLDYALAGDAPCPAEKVLHDEVARHLGYDPFIPGAARRVAVTIERAGSKLSGRVEMADGAGAPRFERTAAFPDDACLALLSWMGNVIAFRLDRGASPQSAPEHHPSLEPLGASSKPRLPSASPEHPDRADPPGRQGAPSGRAVVAIGPVLTLGAAGPAMGMVAYGGYRWPFFSLGAELRFDAPSSARADTTASNAGVQAYAIGGALVPCGHLRGAFLCALFLGGAISTSGIDLSFPHRVTYPQLGGGLRVGVEHAFMPWLSVRLHLDGLAMLRTQVAMLDGAPVQIPTPLSSRVSGATGLDLMAYF